MAVLDDGSFLYVGSDLGTVYKVDLISYLITSAIPGFDNPSNIALTDNNPPATSVNGCLINTDPMNISRL